MVHSVGLGRGPALFFWVQQAWVPVVPACWSHTIWTYRSNEYWSSWGQQWVAALWVTEARLQCFIGWQWVEGHVRTNAEATFGPKATCNLCYWLLETECFFKSSSKLISLWSGLGNWAFIWRYMTNLSPVSVITSLVFPIKQITQCRCCNWHVFLFPFSHEKFNISQWEDNRCKKWILVLCITVQLLLGNAICIGY